MNEYTKEMRIRRGADFDSVYANNMHAADDVLVILARINDLQQTRLGLSVSRRVGCAVVRNRWKRRIREAFRLHRHSLPVGLDLVIRPRRGAEPDFIAIKQSLPELVRRVHRKLS